LILIITLRRDFSKEEGGNRTGSNLLYNWEHRIKAKWDRSDSFSESNVFGREESNSFGRTRSDRRHLPVESKNRLIDLTRRIDS
jgi:hypothetical protein